MDARNETGAAFLGLLVSQTLTKWKLRTTHLDSVVSVVLWVSNRNRRSILLIFECPKNHPTARYCSTVIVWWVAYWVQVYGCRIHNVTMGRSTVLRCTPPCLTGSVENGLGDRWDGMKMDLHGECGRNADAATSVNEGASSHEGRGA